MFTLENLSELERLSNINLVHIYSEEITKVKNGANSNNLFLRASEDYQSWGSLGVFITMMLERVLSEECVEVLERERISLKRNE